MNADVTGQNSFFRPDSAQAGEAIIDYGSAKKVKSRYVNNNNNKAKHKYPDKIELQNDTELSQLLKSSAKNTNSKIIIEDNDRIMPFEIDFHRLDADDTVENNTKVEYIENTFKVGKAKRMNENAVHLKMTESPRAKAMRIRTLEGVAISTSSINITDTNTINKALHKRDKAARVNQNL